MLESSRTIKIKRKLVQSVGGGAVSVKVNGQKELIEVKIIMTKY